MQFERDKAKAASNLRKHSLSFADAADKFPSYETVDEALRFLVRIMEQHQTELLDK